MVFIGATLTLKIIQELAKISTYDVIKFSITATGEQLTMKLILDGKQHSFEEVVSCLSIHSVFTISFVQFFLNRVNVSVRPE